MSDLNTLYCRFAWDAGPLQWRAHFARLLFRLRLPSAASRVVGGGIRNLGLHNSPSGERQ